MDLPQEVELWYVIPSIRKALVTELKKHGLKQKDIAKLLGITESAISQYIKDKRASCCSDFFDRPLLSKEIKRSADSIVANAEKSPNIVIKEINRLCRFIREKRIICEIGKRKYPSRSKCNICFE